MADNRPIGVFDSGLGGLTVVRELKRLMPNEDIVYFGDTGRVPYGSRSNETIKRYAADDEKILLNRGVKLIIAACGTVSAVAAKEGKLLPVPFFEVVTSAAEYAARITKNNKIGVIGTGATIRSSAHKKELIKLSPTVSVYENACPLFVPLVEEGWIDKNDSVVKGTVEKYLKPIKEKGVDTLILGCTHYPILKDAISEYMGDGVTLVNMGIPAVENVKKYMEENSLCREDGTDRYIRYMVSDKTASFGFVASVLMGEKIDPDTVELINVNL